MTQQKTSTRQTTSYLKGLAILLVLVTHYSSAYASGLYDRLIRDYAGFVVSIFFILSGYGIYYSLRRLEEHYGGKPLSFRLMGTFFWQRALRVYPLYWLSLLSASYILGNVWEQFHTFSFRTLATYMAFPTIRPPGYAWFIPELVQCYLVAPFLYYLLRKLHHWRYMAFIAALGAVFTVITVYFWQLLDAINGFGVPDPYSLLYRSMFLSNILLFAAGLYMPVLIHDVKKYASNYTTVAFFAAFLASLYFVRDEFFQLNGQTSQLVLFPLFLISVSGFCLSAIAANRPLPLNRPVAWLGGFSFTLYLFHWQYYTLLEKAGLINDSEWQSALATIALFPIFMAACMVLQWAANRVRLLLDRPAVKKA
ncbi:MAG: acyltransferase [Thermoleophilia bacterium]|nr:acyltransferase [Thermoleophilia bacterium]